MKTFSTKLIQGAIQGLMAVVALTGQASAQDLIQVDEVLSSGDVLEVIPVRIYRDITGSVVATETITSDATEAHGSFSIGMGAPLGTTVSLGVIIGPMTASGTPLGGAALNRGVLLEVTVGQGGGQMSAGYAVRGGVALVPLFFFIGGIDLKATLLHNWDDLGLIQKGQTFLGPQLDFNLYLFKVSLGVLRRVMGSQPGYDWLMTGGLGLGF